MSYSMQHWISYEEPANRGEEKNFLRTALTLRGSVTRRVLPRVAVAATFSSVVVSLTYFVEAFHIPVTPFEYSGVVLGLLLVQRMNSGLDRWWEARKLWGSIVNQSRNLAIITRRYSQADENTLRILGRWIAAWPHVMRESLRSEKKLEEVAELLGDAEAVNIRSAQHMPTYVGSRIAELLHELRKKGLDDFAFQRAERERALLIDAIGACERIRSTPMPLALAIKTRRFLFLFLLLLPFGLADRAGWYTPLVVALASYPLFSLDEIGVELQNPFSPRNLSHLPLIDICRNIELNVMSLYQSSPGKKDRKAS